MKSLILCKEFSQRVAWGTGSRCHVEQQKWWFADPAASRGIKPLYFVILASDPVRCLDRCVPNTDYPATCHPPWTRTSVQQKGPVLGFNNIPEIIILFFNDTRQSISAFQHLRDFFVCLWFVFFFPHGKTTQKIERSVLKGTYTVHKLAIWLFSFIFICYSNRISSGLKG